MATSRVLKFARSDEESGCILLNVTFSGSKPLDAKLEATEGEGRYVGTLKHDRVASLQVKNCPVSEADWQTILASILNQESVEDIQAAATVQSEASLSITIRKQVQGITQRLGAITLKYDMSEDIQLFDWCELSAQAAAESKAAAAGSLAKTQELETAVTELKAQLDELVQAKDQDETALLHKFRNLLNEKKVKIREQQKVLDAASFNANPAASSQASQKAQSPPTRQPAKSRLSKRKAKAPAVEEESDDDAADDVDIKSEQEDTDPGDTDETALVASDNDADDVETVAPPPSSTVQQAGNTDSASKKTTYQPPPPRSLPFGNRKPAIPATKAVAAGADEDTDSDDEL